MCFDILLYHHYTLYAAMRFGKRENVRMAVRLASFSSFNLIEFPSLLCRAVHNTLCAGWNYVGMFFFFLHFPLHTVSPSSSFSHFSSINIINTCPLGFLLRDMRVKYSGSFLSHVSVDTRMYIYFFLIIFHAISSLSLLWESLFVLYLRNQAQVH